MSCRDGTSGCPIVGTFGSWGFYVIGIYMAVVFLLGPKTNYGLSEQNPAFWIQLLIIARDSPKITWYDPIKHKHHERQLSVMDPQIWFRFFMTFLINGVGFHVLVHALPIQMASQSSFTGVVFRAVGMMYLVDLDDSPGYTLTVMEESTKTKKEISTSRAVQSTFEGPQNGAEIGDDYDDLFELSNEAQRIIDEARAKLELLARMKGRVKPMKAGLAQEPTGRIKKEPKLALNTDSESEEEHPRNKSRAHGVAERKHIFDAYDETGVEVCESTGMAEF
jgi:hypothetical protein